MVRENTKKGSDMHIHVTCPNGHKLKVDRKFAGRNGQCPQCKCTVQIPELKPRDVGEDAIMDILAARSAASIPADTLSGDSMSGDSIESALVGSGDSGSAIDLPVHQDARSDDTKQLSEDDSAIRGGSSIKRRATRRCSGCGHRVTANFSVCPHCKRYMTEVPEAGAQESLKCPSCGVPSFPGEDVCLNCGLQLLLRE